MNYSRRKLFKSTLLSLAAFSAKGCSTLERNYFFQKKSSTGLRLLFLTDIHFDDSKLANKTLKIVYDIVSEISVDVLIFGGDLISEGLILQTDIVSKRMEFGARFLTSLPSPLISIPGNHDLHLTDSNNKHSYAQAARSIYSKAFSLEPYSPLTHSIIKGHHILAIDSIELQENGTEYIGVVSDSLLRLLSEKLKFIPNSEPIILLSHMPFLTVRYQATEGAKSSAPANRVVTNSDVVLKSFQNHNLRLVLQGHLHVYERIEWNNTVFITGGAVSGGWWNGDWLGTERGLCLIEIDEEDVSSSYIEV